MRPADGHGQRGVVDPRLLRRAALVSALCLKRLDGMKIQVRSDQSLEDKRLGKWERCVLQG